MFRRLLGFFRRLFTSKAFRICLFLFSMTVLALCVYDVFLYLKVAGEIGITPKEALSLFFGFPMENEGPHVSVESLIVGSAIGLFFVFRLIRRRRQKQEPLESKEEKPEEVPAPAPVQEEETIEPPRYLSR